MIKNQYISLFNFVSVGICVIDIDYKILLWNNSLAGLTNIKPDDAIGNYLYDFYPEFKKKINLLRVNDVALGGPPAIFSASLNKTLFAPINNNNNESYYYEIVATSLNTEPDIEKLVIFSIEDRTSLYTKVMDYKRVKDLALIEIEQRKVIEESLKLANQSKDKFISIMAHDIKNPLGVIQSVSDFLVKTFDELDKDEILQFLNGMYQSSKKLNGLINDLLAWGRTQSGSQNVNLSDNNFYDLTNEVIDLLKLNAEKKSIKLINKVSPHIIISYDNFMINTVVRNLASNAIKFTNIGGIVTISCLKIEENYVISVEDNGVGISPNDASKLFVLGESKSRPGTDNEDGTGLGLLLTKEFIAIHKGRIWVESELGKGSIFKFTIPIT